MDPREWNQEEWERESSRRGVGARLFLTITLMLLAGLVVFAIISYSGLQFDFSLTSSDSRTEEPGGSESRGSEHGPSFESPAIPYSPPVRAPLPRLDPEDYGPNVMTSETVKNVVELCGDAVVRIAVEVTRVTENPFSGDPFFRDFFGDQEPRTETGMGSGFFFRDTGYILTNDHVIDGADNIKVYLTSRQEPYDAVVVGKAPELDLAVIKIEGEGFP